MCVRQHYIHIENFNLLTIANNMNNFVFNLFLFFFFFFPFPLFHSQLSSSIWTKKERKKKLTFHVFLPLFLLLLPTLNCIFLLKKKIKHIKSIQSAVERVANVTWIELSEKSVLCVFFFTRYRFQNSEKGTEKKWKNFFIRSQKLCFRSLAELAFLRIFNCYKIANFYWI